MLDYRSLNCPLPDFKSCQFGADLMVLLTNQLMSILTYFTMRFNLAIALSINRVISV